MNLNTSKFLKRNSLDAVMFGYVSAMIFNFPTATIENALINFSRFVKHEDVNIDSCKVTYHRMQKEFLESRKTA